VKNGFSLPETLVALGLGAAIATAVFGVVAMHRTVYLDGVSQLEGVATVRLAAGLLSGELRGLDPAGGDLLDISSTSVRYRAARNLYYTCRPPDPARSRLTVSSSFHGLRGLNPDLDSVLLYAPADPAAVRPAGWIVADVRRVVWGQRCPGGAESLTLELGGIQSQDVVAVETGSPVRGFSVWEVRGYGDSRGRWWLGMRRLSKGGGRSGAIQPVLGPLAPGGFEVRVFDQDGTSIDDPQAVVSIGFTVLPEASGRPVTLRVALRGVHGR
jgi:hypothetical protein